MKTTSKALTRYKEKRNFGTTSEPSGAEPSDKSAKRSSAKKSKGSTETLAFVIQKHDASRLHYDFRLEINGVLASWAVPKGPSLDPAQKRLAVHVEDHPLEYGTFEGTIPAGEYGAGEVIVWDFGSWTPLEPEDPADYEKAGFLKFELNGKKLKGKWHLLRFRTEDKSDNWLLMKEKDKFARPGTDAEVLTKHPNSALTGKPIKPKKVSSKKEKKSPSVSKKSSRR